MKQRRRKFISIVMMVTMIFTMIPSVSFATGGHVHSYDSNGGCTCGAHGGSLGTDHTGWTALSQSDFNGSGQYYKTNHYELDEASSSSEVKSYYLTEDISLDKEIDLGTVNAGTVNLCLNGNVLDCSAGALKAFNLKNGVKLNIFDCNSENKVHYFTKSGADTYFDTYEPNYNILGKTENVDYVAVSGGVFTATSKVVDAYNSGTKYNIYGTTIIGCDKNSLSLIESNTESGSVGLYGMEIRDNDEDNQELISFDVSPGDNVQIKDVNIFNNTCTAAIKINEGNNATIEDSAIKNNIIMEYGAVVYDVPGIGEFVADLTLKGNVIIKDNLMEGKQKNLVVSGGQRNFSACPFKVNGLTSEENSIGIANIYNVATTGQLPICRNIGTQGKAFYSDDSNNYISTSENVLYLKNRFEEQPSSNNSYTAKVQEDGLQSVTYQWYRGDIETKEFDNDDVSITEGLENKATCDAGVWTSCNVENRYFPLFDVELSSGSVFKCDFDFTGLSMNNGVYFGEMSLYDEYGITSTHFKQNSEFSFTASDDGIYSMTGCFGDEPVNNIPKIKNARVEKFTPTAEVTGQTSNQLTNGDIGKYYVCKITMTDKDGVVREVSSCPVKVTEKITPQPSYNPTTPDEPTVEVEKPKSTVVKSAKTSLKITIKKPSGKNADGYQVRYCLKKNMKKSKTKNISSKKSKTTVTIKKLKPGKTYYVQVRTIKMKNGKPYYSSWTKIKKIRTK